LRANAGGDHVMRRHGALSAVLNRAGRRAGRMGLAVNASINALYTVGLAISLVGGVILFQRHEVSLGTVYLFVQYTNMMANPLAQIGMQLQQFQAAGAGLSRVRDLQATPTKIIDGHGVAWPPSTPASATTSRCSTPRFPTSASRRCLRISASAPGCAACRPDWRAS